MCGKFSGFAGGWDFKQFVEDMELVDLPLLGREFTWYKADGSAMSCLD